MKMASASARKTSALHIRALTASDTGALEPAFGYRRDPINSETARFAWA